MALKRRDFLKLAGAAGLTLASGTTLKASQIGVKKAQTDPEFRGVLIDTTLCEGCRACEQACNERNKLPAPEKDFSDYSVFDQKRDTTPTAFKVINKFDVAESPDKPVFVPRQCLHCNQPACASACLTRALQKTKEGPVVYTASRCMGCRYCMIACPFDIPKYEYNSAAPLVKKCIGCFTLAGENGGPPACAAACPTGATTFGTRRELLEEARKRIYQNPDKYHHHIYGENEVGGTGVMYLSAVPFEKIGFKTDLGPTPYPEHTTSFLYSVPLVFVAWPALLMGLTTIVKGDGEKEKTGQTGKESSHG